MSKCRENKSCAIEALQNRQRGTLAAVLRIDAVMFVAILTAGIVANGICLALLWKHRADDVNMSSVWECSRNDIASNLSVLLAAGGVWLTGAAWPDLVIGGLLALMFLRSAVRVLRGAWSVLLAQPAHQTGA